MRLHEPRHIAEGDAAVGERALEVATLLEIVQLAPKPGPLAPAFDGEQDLVRELCNGSECFAARSARIRLKRLDHHQILLFGNI